MTAPATPAGAFGLKIKNAGVAGAIRGQVLLNGITSGYGSSLYEGDPVTITNGKAVVAVAGSGFDAIFNSCEFTPVGGRGRVGRYFPANTAYKANTFGTDGAGNSIGIRVGLTPTENYPMDVLADGAVAQTAIGSLANVVSPGTGSAFFGSQAFVDHTTVGSGADVKIVGVGEQVTNGWGATHTIITVVNAKASPALNR